MFLGTGGGVSSNGSSGSLDVGYGKCPEFVCVDGLIVSKDNGWQDSDSGHDQSMSHQGTLSTLRYIISFYHLHILFNP